MHAEPQGQFGTQTTKPATAPLGCTVYNVWRVIIQDNGKTVQTCVFAQLQEQFGTKQFSNVSVLVDRMALNVSNAHFQGNGMTIQTHATVLP